MKRLFNWAARCFMGFMHAKHVGPRERRGVAMRGRLSGAWWRVRRAPQCGPWLAPLSACSSSLGWPRSIRLVTKPTHEGGFYAKLAVAGDELAYDAPPGAKH